MESKARAGFMKCQRRGPEFSTFENHDRVMLGFHRLAINGQDAGSHQPLTLGDDLVLICNGEIYNHKALYTMMGATPNTHSDCEVILHLYQRYGIHQTLTMLDGVFALVLWDKRNDTVYVARDPLGVRPLYRVTSSYNLMQAFASEAKCLVEPTFDHYGFEQSLRSGATLGQFEPGHVCTIRLLDGAMISEMERYTMIPTLWHQPETVPDLDMYHPSLAKGSTASHALIHAHLEMAVQKRCENTDRPVACLLSGGLDSSLVASLVVNHFKKQGKQVETFSIGMEGSEDLAYARKVADFIGSKHHEVIVTEDEMFQVIPEVIDALETHDVTTVRASLGNYLLGKYIATHSDAKVIFNGDGSDELFGGYLYMHKCPDSIEFDRETRRLLSNIHKFDVLRSDKCISSHGLEPRTPFLDKTLVSCVMSIPPSFRNHNVQGKMEKYLLREAFEFQLDGTPLLPREVLFRKKEAFSDGVSHKTRSLFTILQEKIHALGRPGKEQLYGIELERDYYRELFDAIFPNDMLAIEDTWMPKYVDATDPSARTLQLYNQTTSTQVSA